MVFGYWWRRIQESLQILLVEDSYPLLLGEIGAHCAEFGYGNKEFVLYVGIVGFFSEIYYSTQAHLVMPAGR